MPDPKVETAIELAKRIGTYGKIDRSAQYQGNYSPKALLHNDDLQFQKLRQMERSRFRHHLIAIVLAAVLARAPEIAAFVMRLLR
jgi:hypothetical protein